VGGLHNTLQPQAIVGAGKLWEKHKDRWSTLECRLAALRQRQALA